MGQKTARDRYIDNLIRQIKETDSPKVNHAQKTLQEKAYEESIYRTGQMFKESRIIQEQESNWNRTVKEQLLGECLNKVYSGALKRLMGDEVNLEKAKGVVGNYIREQGVDNILRKMQYRSVLLSEMYQLVNKYHSLIMEDCKKKEKESGSKCFKVPEDCKDSFYDELDMTDTDEVEFQISDRVSASIDSFLNNNTMTKLNIKQILQSSQEKLQQAKTDIQRESVERLAQQDIYNARNSRAVGIFDEMVSASCKTVVSSNDEALRECYMQEGGTKINVEKIVENTKYTYTLMEALNALWLEKFTEESLLKDLKSM